MITGLADRIRAWAFERFGRWDALPEPDSTDLAAWAATRTLLELGDLTVRWLRGDLRMIPAYCALVDVDEDIAPGLTDALTALNRAGMPTIDSQGAFEGLLYPGSPMETWGAVDAYVYLFADAAGVARLRSALDGAPYTASFRPPGKGWSPRRELADGWTGYGLCHPDLVTAVCGAWQVRISDPVLGQNRLWAWITTNFAPRDERQTAVEGTARTDALIERYRATGEIDPDEVLALAAEPTAPRPDLGEVVARTLFNGLAMKDHWAEADATTRQRWRNGPAARVVAALSAAGALMPDTQVDRPDLVEVAEAAWSERVRAGDLGRHTAEMRRSVLVSVLAALSAAGAFKPAGGQTTEEWAVTYLAGSVQAIWARCETREDAEKQAEVARRENDETGRWPNVLVECRTVTTYPKGGTYISEWQPVDGD